MAQDENTLLLGEIKGKMDLLIDAHKETNDTVKGMDTRLRKVETKAAINGALSGGLVSIGMAIVIEKIKAVVGIGGS